MRSPHTSTIIIIIQWYNYLHLHSHTHPRLDTRWGVCLYYILMNTRAQLRCTNALKTFFLFVIYITVLRRAVICARFTWKIKLSGRYQPIMIFDRPTPSPFRYWNSSKLDPCGCTKLNPAHTRPNNNGGFGEEELATCTN